MADQYFIKRGEKVHGPYTGEQISSGIKSKKLTAEDEVSVSKNGPWNPLQVFYNTMRNMQVVQGAVGPQAQVKTSSSENSTPRPNVVIAANGESTGSSLVKCEDCGKSISRRASSCPHCGAPSPTPATAQKGKTNAQKGKKNIVLAHILCGILYVVFLYLGLGFGIHAGGHEFIAGIITSLFFFVNLIAVMFFHKFVFTYQKKYLGPTNNTSTGKGVDSEHVSFFAALKSHSSRPLVKRLFAVSVGVYCLLLIASSLTWFIASRTSINDRDRNLRRQSEKMKKSFDKLEENFYTPEGLERLRSERGF